jgi:hypothetical protein
MNRLGFFSSSAIIQEAKNASIKKANKAINFYRD